MASNGLCMKLNLAAGEVRLGEFVDLLVNPVDLPLEDGYAS